MSVYIPSIEVKCGTCGEKLAFSSEELREHLHADHWMTVELEPLIGVYAVSAERWAYLAPEEGGGPGTFLCDACVAEEVA